MLKQKFGTIPRLLSNTANSQSLPDVFLGYRSFFQEAMWLIEQKTFHRICLSKGYLDEEQLKSALSTQLRAWQSGKQIHLGEVCLQTYLLNEKHIYLILKNLGYSIKYSASNDTSFCTSFFSSDISPFGEILQDDNFKESYLQQIFHMTPSWPRFISQKTMPHKTFHFLDLEKFCESDLLALEKEAYQLFQSFYHWVTSTLLIDGATEDFFSVLDIGRDSNRLKESKAIMRKIAAYSQEADPIQAVSSKSSFTSIYSGYMQIIGELFWLISQKMFQKLCVAQKYISMKEMDEAIQVQKRAFQSGKQFHIAEILLQMYLLNEEQVYQILKSLGTQMLYCLESDQYFQVFQQSTLKSWEDESDLQEVVPERDVLVCYLRDSFATPFPIRSDNTSCQNKFSFFVPREGYSPQFVLDSSEITQAYSSYIKSLSANVSELQKRLSSKFRKGVSSSEKSGAAPIRFSKGKSSFSVRMEEVAQKPKAKNRNVSIREEEKRSTLFMEKMEREAKQALQEKEAKETAEAKPAKGLLSKIRKTFSMPAIPAREPKNKEDRPKTLAMQAMPVSQEEEEPEVAEHNEIDALAESKGMLSKIRMTFSFPKLSKETLNSSVGEESVVAASPVGEDSMLDIGEDSVFQAAPIGENSAVAMGMVSNELLVETPDNNADFPALDNISSPKEDKGDMERSRILDALEKAFGISESNEGSVKMSDGKDTDRSRILQALEKAFRISQEMEAVQPTKPETVEKDMDPDNFFKSLEEDDDEEFDVMKESNVRKESLQNISQEVDAFMESIDGLDVDAPDEALYEKFVDKLANISNEYQLKKSEQKQILKAISGEFFKTVVGKESSISDTEERPNVTFIRPKTVNYTKKSLAYTQKTQADALKATNRFRDVVPTQMEYIGGYTSVNRSRKKTSFLPLAALAAAFLFGFLYVVFTSTPEPIKNIEENTKTTSTNTKNNNSKYTPPEIIDNNPDQVPEFVIETPKEKDQPTEIVENTPTKIGIIEKLLQKTSSSAEIAKELRKIVNRNKLSPADLEALKRLYTQFSQNKAIRLLTIRSLGEIGGTQAKQWLEEILITPSETSDRTAAVQALEKMGDSEAMNTIINMFRREADSDVCRAASYALCRLAPENDEVQQTLIAKFHEVSDKTVRRSILTAIGSMRIDSQNIFLVQVAINSQYSTATRLEAINSLMINSTGKAKNYISELSTLSNVENEEIRKKVSQAIEMFNTPDNAINLDGKKDTKNVFGGF